MNEESTPGFKISLNDEPPKAKEAAPVQKDNQRVKKPGRGMTITILLLFILVLGAMIAGYWDIKKRLLTVHHTGTQEAQNLSTDIQSKFSSLSLRSAALEETVNQITQTQSSLKNALDALKIDLNKVSNLVASKADKKKVEDSTAALDKKLSPFSKEIKKQTNAISSLKNSIKKDLSGINQKVLQSTQETKAFQERIAAIRSEKASKKDLLAEINSIQKKQDKLEINLKRIITRLESNLNQVEKEIKKFKLSSSKPATTVTPPPSTPPKLQTKPEPSSFPPVKPYRPQKPGELLEQDISQ